MFPELYQAPLKVTWERTAVAASSPATKRRGKAKKLPSYESNPMATRETLEIVRAYYKITDPEIPKTLRK